MRRTGAGEVNKTPPEWVGIAPRWKVLRGAHGSRWATSVMRYYPPGFEDNDRLRSDFIRHLTLQQLERNRATSIGESAGQAQVIPRTLVQYWDDPYGVPADVRRCLDSWEGLREEGFSMRMFGDASAHTYIA